MEFNIMFNFIILLAASVIAGGKGKQVSDEAAYSAKGSPKPRLDTKGPPLTSVAGNPIQSWVNAPWQTGPTLTTRPGRLLPVPVPAVAQAQQIPQPLIQKRSTNMNAVSPIKVAIGVVPGQQTDPNTSGGVMNAIGGAGGSPTLPPSSTATTQTANAANPAVAQAKTSTCTLGQAAAAAKATLQATSSGTSYPTDGLYNPASYGLNTLTTTTSTTMLANAIYVSAAANDQGLKFVGTTFITAFMATILFL